MKRGSFLKTLATLIVTPSLISKVDASDKKESVIPKEKDKPKVVDTPNVNSGIVRVYCDTSKYRVGDIVITDLGDLGRISTVASLGKSESLNFIEIKPIRYGFFRYNDLSKIGLLSAAHKEA